MLSGWLNNAHAARITDKDMDNGHLHMETALGTHFQNDFENRRLFSISLVLEFAYNQFGVQSNVCKRICYVHKT